MFMVNQLNGFNAGGGLVPKVVTRGAGNTGTGTSATVTITLPTGIVAGDRVILAVFGRGTPTWTWPGGWTELADAGGLSVAYRDCDGTEGASINATMSTGARSAWATIRLQAGTFRSGTAPVLTSSTATSTDPDPAAIAPTWDAPTLWLPFAGVNSTTAVTAGPSGYSNFQTSKATNDPSCSSAEREDPDKVPSASEDPGTFACAVSAFWECMTVAVRDTS